MRIISNFKDYYDVGMQYGYDPKLQWIRKYVTYPHTNSKLRSADFLLHFCGNIYRGISVGDYPYLIDIIWDTAHYEAHCKLHNISPREVNYLDQVWLFKRKAQKTKIITLGKLERLSNLNEKYHSTVVLETRGDIKVNTSLKGIQFYKVYDPITTYQKISEYFGNRFFNEPKMVPISDKDRIKQHGFDEKSFRMAKSTNK